MIDPEVQRLLERVIDSPVRLHLLLIFSEHPRMEASAEQLAERTCRDIWSVKQALEALVAHKILVKQPDEHEQIRYLYAPEPQQLAVIHRLVHHYDDPLLRDRVQRMVRELASYTAFLNPHAYDPLGV